MAPTIWGWGVMNSIAIKEVVAVGYPREKMYGVWWPGAEQDVRPAEFRAPSAHCRSIQAAREFAKVPQWAETGEILYVRGLINAMLGVEAMRTAGESSARSR
jgi:branched-chain amino acid transport system substrate-binding protein